MSMSLRSVISTTLNSSLSLSNDITMTSLSRVSLDAHISTQSSLLATLTTDLTSALSLCSWPEHVKTSDVLNILLWLGRLPSFRKSTIFTDTLPFYTLLSDVLLPALGQTQLQAVLSRNNVVQASLTSAKLVNHLLWLNAGDYRRLSDRVFSIQYQKQIPEQQDTSLSKPSSDLPDYYFLFEKHLIRSLTQVLHSALPMLWKCWFYRKLTRLKGVGRSGQCGKCGQDVVNVVLTQCGHLHCYYCVDGFCGICDEKINRDLYYYS